MSNLVQILRNPEEFRKMLVAEWTFPPIEPLIPGYFAALAGFVMASTVALIAAALLLPSKPSGAKVAQKKGATDSPEAAASLGMPATQPLSLPPPAVVGDFKNITGRNIFNSEGTIGEEKGKLKCELKKSEMPFKFTGVIFGGTKETSLVVLESSTTKQAETFLVFDSILSDAQIVDIQRERVIIEKGGCQEYLDLEQPPLPKRRVAGDKVRKAESKGGPGAATYVEEGLVRTGSNTQVEKRFVDKALGPDFPKTLQDAKANPNMVGAEIKGFVLTKIRPDSVYEKMGFLDGDVVEGINGIELNGMAQAIATLNAMRNEKNINITVKRGGQPITFTVNIK